MTSLSNSDGRTPIHPITVCINFPKLDTIDNISSIIIIMYDQLVLNRMEQSVVGQSIIDKDKKPCCGVVAIQL